MPNVARERLAAVRTQRLTMSLSENNKQKRHRTSRKEGITNGRTSYQLVLWTYRLFIPSSALQVTAEGLKCDNVLPTAQTYKHGAS